MIALIGVMVIASGCSTMNSGAPDSGSSSGQPQSAPSASPEDSKSSSGEASGGSSQHDTNSGQTVATDTPNAYSDVSNRKVIMTAYIQIETTNFNDTTTKIRSLAPGAGGYVQSSSMDVNDNNRKTCTIVLKVPQSAYESTLNEVRKLGTVKSDRSTGSDVTSQYVDLQARLNNSKAEEARLLDIMSKANETSDVIIVEKELARIQGEIESTTAQLNLLKNQVDFATITVYVTEPQPVVAYDWGIGAAFSDGVHVFVGVIGGLIILTGFLIPLALYIVICIGVIYLIFRGATWLYSRFKQHKAATPPPQEEKK